MGVRPIPSSEAGPILSPYGEAHGFSSADKMHLGNRCSPVAPEGPLRGANRRFPTGDGVPDSLRSHMGQKRSGRPNVASTAAWQPCLLSIGQSQYGASARLVATLPIPPFVVQRTIRGGKSGFPYGDKVGSKFGTSYRESLLAACIHPGMSPRTCEASKCKLIRPYFTPAEPGCCAATKYGRLSALNPAQAQLGSRFGSRSDGPSRYGPATAGSLPS